MNNVFETHLMTSSVSDTIVSCVVCVCSGPVDSHHEWSDDPCPCQCRRTGETNSTAAGGCWSS